MNLFRLKPTSLLLTISLLGSFNYLHAQSITWDGLGGDNNWSTAANWGGNIPVAGNTLVFGGNTQTANNNDLAADTSFLGIQFTNDGNTTATSGEFTLSGNSITLSGDIVTTAILPANTTLTDTINLDIVLDAVRTAVANDEHNLILNGDISGAFEFRTGGDAAVTLAGNNTFTSFRLGDGAVSDWNGTTGEKEGFVIVNHNNALGTGNVSSRGSQLQAGVGGIVISNTINVGGGGLRMGGSNDFEIDGDINIVDNGSRGFTNAGTGNITLSGTINTSEGVTPLGFTFEGFGGSGDFIVSGNIIGGGFVNTSSTFGGTVFITGNNSYNSTSIASGTTVIVGDGGTNGTLGTGTVSNAGTLIINRSGTLDLAGNLNGAGSIQLTGTGTVVVGGNMTTSGNITISGGTLQIGNGAAVSATSGSDILNNSALVFNHTGTQTMNGDFSGSGTLTHSGSGTTTLNGNNNYTGDTTINSGLLNITGTNASNITVNDGGNIGGEGSTTGNLTFTAGTSYTLDIDGSTAAALGSTGSGATNIQAVGAGGITVNVANFGAGNVTVLTYGSGGLSWDTDEFTLGTGGSARGTASFSDSGSAVVLDAGYVTNVWTGANGTNPDFWDINTTNNWNNSSDSVFFAGDDAVFDDTATTFTATLQEDITAGTVTFNNNSNDYTLNAAANTTLTSQNGYVFGGNGNVTVNAVLAGATNLVKSGTGTTTINTASTYNGTTTINGGTLKFVDGGIVDNRDYTIGAGSTLELNYVTNNSNAGNNIGTMDLSGNGTFRKTGAITLTQVSAGSTIALGSGSTFHIAEGIYVFGGGGIGSFANNKSELLVDAGAEYRTSATPGVFDALNGAGTVRTGGGLTIGIDNGSGTFSGIIRDDTAYSPNSLTKEGTGTQILSGENFYTGPTFINGGILQIGDGGTDGEIGTGAVTNNASLIFNHTGTSTVAGSISGNGTITHSGSGTTTFSSSTTYTGNTDVNAGLLNISGTNVSNFNVAAGANMGGEGTTTGDITFNGTTHTLEIDASTSEAFGTTGSGTTDVSAVTGNITVNLTGSGSGQVTVLTFGSGGLGGGSAANFQLGTGNVSGRGAGGFLQTSNAIVLDLGFVDNVWQGNDGVNPTFWDVDTSDNWTNSSDTRFFEGDSATFDDTATGTSVALQSDISANAVTFNNSTKDYDISAPASQTLTTGSALTFANGGNVTVATNVDLAANGGLVFSNSGNVTVSSATVTTNGTLTFNNSGDVTMNGTTLNHSGTIDFAGSGNTTISNTFAGVGSLIHSGSGTTTLTGNKAHTGTKTVTNGTLVLVQNAIDTDTATIGAGATLEVNTTGSRSIGTWDHGGDGTWKKTGSAQFNQTSSQSDITYTANGLIHVAEGRYQFGGGTPGRWQNNLGSLQIDAGANFDGRATSIWIDRLIGEGLMQIGGKGTNGLYALTLGVSNGTGVFSGNIQNGTEGSATNRDIFKTGTGTQTLSGTNNTYTGQTIIDQGRLNMSGTFTSVNDITVSANATLGGEGTVAANVILNSGSTLAIDPSTAGAFTTTGNVTAGGPVTVFLDGAPTPGNILVFSYSGNIDESQLVLGTTGTFRDGSFTDNVGANVTLNLGNEDSTWSGTDAVNPTFWDINTSDNWTSSDNRFFDGDNVTFTDNVGNSAGSVVLQGNISAGSVTFTNTAGGNTYNVTSSGSETLSAVGGINVQGGGTVTIGSEIAGTTDVSLTNSSTLILTGNSSSTGGVSIEANSTLRSATTGALDSFNIANEGLVEITGGSHVTSISGNGGLTVNSAGTVNLGGNHSYSGNLTKNNSGRLEINGGTNLSSTSLFDHNGGNVDLENGFDSTVRSYQQTGGTLRFGYTNNGTSGAATLTVLEDSSFTTIQVATTGTLVLADGVNATVTSSVSQLGDPDSFNATVGAGGFLNISGAINSGDGNGAVNTDGPGTVRLTADNSAFGGGTRVSNGTLEFDSIDNINVASSLGDADTVNVLQVGSDSNAATLRMIGTNAKNTTNRAVQIGDAGGTVEVDDVAQVLTFNGIVSGNGTTGNGALTTGGSGTIVLNGQNTYTGGTTVAEGTLLVNNASGSGTGTGAVSVSAGGTLGGTGTIAGDTLISGTHSAGADTSVGSVGTMTHGGDLAYNSGATISWDLIQNSTVSGFDTFAVGGQLDLGAAGGETFTFNVNLSGSVNYYDSLWQDTNSKWRVWEVAMADVIGFDAGEFTINLNDAGVAGGPQSAGIFAFTQESDGIYLNLTTAVPEPSTYAMMGLGLAGFGWFVRRRRIKSAVQEEEK